MGVAFRAGESRGKTTKARSPATAFIIGVWKCFSINRDDVFVI